MKALTMMSSYSIPAQFFLCGLTRGFPLVNETADEQSSDRDIITAVRDDVGSLAEPRRRPWHRWDFPSEAGALVRRRGVITSRALLLLGIVSNKDH